MITSSRAFPIVIVRLARVGRRVPLRPLAGSGHCHICHDRGWRQRPYRGRLRVATQFEAFLRFFRVDLTLLYHVLSHFQNDPQNDTSEHVWPRRRRDLLQYDDLRLIRRGDLAPTLAQARAIADAISFLFGSPVDPRRLFGQQPFRDDLRREA